MVFDMRKINKKDKFYIDKHWETSKNDPLFKGDTKKTFAKEFLEELRYIRKNKKNRGQ